MNDKQLSDFLPNKNTSYFKKFQNLDSTKVITKEDIIKEIKKVMDPEIPVNLYDLGLIYRIDIDKINNIIIHMTLTNPNCPVAGAMPESVGLAIEKISFLSSVKVDLVWYPKWNKSMMSEEAKLALDIF
jgi:FeS assembly SUF system protein